MAVRPDTPHLLRPSRWASLVTIHLGASHLPWLAAMVGIGACRAAARPAGASLNKTAVKHTNNIRRIIFNAANPKRVFMPLSR